MAYDAAAIPVLTDQGLHAGRPAKAFNLALGQQAWGLEQAAWWVYSAPMGAGMLVWEAIWERLRAWDTADLPLATDLRIYSR